MPTDNETYQRVLEACLNYDQDPAFVTYVSVAIFNELKEFLPFSEKSNGQELQAFKSFLRICTDTHIPKQYKDLNPDEIVTLQYDYTYMDGRLYFKKVSIND